jgi:tetratricopeptide (TPR) repeat protein
MKPMLTTALALVMAASAAPAAAQYGSYGSSAPAQSPQPVPQGQQAGQQGQQAAQPAKPSVLPSKKAVNAIVDLQTAVNNKDVANIPAKLAAAQAVAQTKEDHYLIARLQLQAAAAANDNPAMEAALGAIAASNYLGAAQMSDLYVALGGTYYNNKQYPQAAAAFQKALAVNPQNADAGPMVAEAMLGAGQKVEAAAAFQRLIQARAAAGQKPEENLYKRAVAIAYDAKSPAAIDIARQWVAAYPTPSSWSDAIAIYRNLNLGDAEATLDLLRLKQAMGSLTTKDYADLAGAATDQLIFDEAQKVADAGVAAKMIDPASASGRDLLSVLKVKAKPTAADLAEAMKVAANGKALMRIGDNYAALGDYAHAVEAYKLAMAKPDGDAALANLHIGMALARSGDKAGAATALNAVTGARAGIAKYWLTYLSQKA